MLSKRQQILILVSTLGGIIIIALVISALTNKPRLVPVEQIPSTVSEVPVEPIPVVAPEEVTIAKPKPVKKPVAPVVPALTYDQVVESYRASGYRFQFYTCSGSPGSLSLKKGTKFMMDNRDAGSHAFVVGTQKFSIGGYGYKVVTASEVGKINITCDGKGAASLNVQL